MVSGLPSFTGKVSAASGRNIHDGLCTDRITTRPGPRTGSDVSRRSSEEADELFHMSQVDGRLPTEDFNRREFLTLMAAATALAGLTGCSPAAPENIVPYVRAPENELPGSPRFFSTAFEMNGYGTGLIVKSEQGRPIKVEGNPAHPASLGATDTFAQASLLTLYDPDRAQTVSNAGQISTWDAFITELSSRLASFQSNADGLRI